MVQFKPDTAWEPAPRRVGAPAIEVPAILSEWLEYTLRERKVCEIPADPDDEGTKDLLRAGRIYCTRQGRKFHYQFITEDGNTVLQFRMRDARVYKKRGLPR